jgi:hypothetical protein
MACSKIRLVNNGNLITGLHQNWNASLCLGVKRKCQVSSQSHSRSGPHTYLNYHDRVTFLRFNSLFLSWTHDAQDELDVVETRMRAQTMHFDARTCLWRSRCKTHILGSFACKPPIFPPIWEFFPAKLKILNNFWLAWDRQVISNSTYRK